MVVGLTRLDLHALVVVSETFAHRLSGILSCAVPAVVGGTRTRQTKRQEYR